MSMMETYLNTDKCNSQVDKQKQMIVIALSLLMAALLSGCSLTKMAVAQARSRDQFIETKADPNVRYYQGSEMMAERVVKAMARSSAIVERTHGAAFTHAPQVFVCHTDCFTSFVPVSKEVAAAQFADSVFMHDDVLRLRELEKNMPPESFLTHELAHLLLYQHAGPIAYMRVPAWFREGIAVSVSDGAGAEACKPAEAALSVLAEKAFDPAEAGSIFRDRTAASYRLRPSIFYRQAGMFIDYLREIDPAAFQAALHEVLNGDDFKRSFNRAYGRSIASHWPGFVERMKKLVSQASSDS